METVLLVAMGTMGLTCTLCYAKKKVGECIKHQRYLYRDKFESADNTRRNAPEQTLLLPVGK